jgi:DNA-binding NtrC family response regulator
MHAVGIMRDVMEAKMREDELREAATRSAAHAGDETAAAREGSLGSWTDAEQAPSTEGSGNMGPLDQILTTIERREILAALNRANGQRTLAARLLGISRSRLYRRMEALGIDPRELSSAGETPLRQDA